MRITPANISWANDQPRAIDFDDIYFSADGIAEVKRVLIEPSHVLDKAHNQACVCVAELGFGTGLNFAVLADAVVTQSNAQLRFISFEKHPLKPQDWQAVFDAPGRELPIYKEMQTQPLAQVPGWQQRIFANGRVILSVYHGDVLEGLSDLVTRQKNPVDTWFLDGFSPAKNPSMWTPEIYAKVAAMAAPDTTVATFTSVGNVRRGLRDVGFTMRRVDQQPIKHHSLAGYFTGQSTRSKKSATSNPPVTSVTIHGAGLGGACMARYLAEQQVKVDVYDPQGVAAGASQIGAAILHSRLLSDGSADATLRLESFHFAVNYLKRFAGFTQTGVVQAQGPNLDAAKLERVSHAYSAANPDQHDWLEHITAEDATKLSGMMVHGDALYFPTGGVVDGRVLCAALLDHSNITVHQKSQPEMLSACNIVCAASATRDFPGCAHLEISEVWGQLDCYESTSKIARMPIVGNGYLVPTESGCVIGASYEYEPWTMQTATAHNERLNQHYLDKTELTWQYATRAPRAVTSDRIPVVGRLSPHETNADSELWLATAFGSMGTTAAPLAAAIIGSELLGWLPPTSAEVVHLTRPARFAERQARRGVRHIKTESRT